MNGGLLCGKFIVGSLMFAILFGILAPTSVYRSGFDGITALYGNKAQVCVERP